MKCIRCGSECKAALCRKCSRSHNFCDCGKVKQRKVKQCKDCRPAKIPVMCIKCGKNPRQTYNPVCRDCYVRHQWTQDEDDFFAQNYPIYGAEWCANQLNLSLREVKNRVGQLGICLNKDVYYKKVHAAATVANTGTKRTPEQREEMRKRALENIDSYKERLLKGRLANQKNKPSNLERKLWIILKELGVIFESQVEIKKSFLVDVRIGNMIIEADGDWWHGHKRFEPLTEQQEKQQIKDKSKDTYLKKIGYAVERVWESDMSHATIKNVLIKHGILTNF